MHILFLEIKRVLQTRNTLILIGVALLLSCLVAVNVISGERIYDRDYNLLYTGIEAIHKGREIDAPYEGLVLPEMLLDAHEQYRALSQQYGGVENIPETLYQEHILGLREYINLVGAVSVDPNTGFTIAPEERKSEQILNFYQNRDSFVADKLAKHNLKDDYEALKNALAINAEVETPFVFYSYRGWINACENIALLIFLIIIICATIAAPIFSSEYQTGSDYILRCTKHGKTRLVITKLLSVMLISLLLYAICLILISSIFLGTLGGNGLNTSIQMPLPTAIAPLTIGQLNTWVILTGALTLVATICFTLFLSAKYTEPVVALIISIVIILLPTIMRPFVDGDLQLSRFFLPSGGTGLGNGIFYELIFNPSFLSIGSFALWSPYVIIIAAVINILIFGFLTVSAYLKHE